MLGVSGKFPPAYIGGVFSGQAVGGIFASVTAVVMIALGTGPKDQAFFCFLVAVIFLAGSLVFYLIITRSEFYQYYLAENVQTNEAKLENINHTDAPITEESEFLDKEKAIINSEEGDGPHPPPMKVVIPHKGMSNPWPKDQLCSMCRYPIIPLHHNLSYILLLSFQLIRCKFSVKFQSMPFRYSRFFWSRSPASLL